MIEAINHITAGRSRSTSGTSGLGFSLPGIACFQQGPVYSCLHPVLLPGLLQAVLTKPCHKKAIKIWPKRTL